MFFYDVMRIPKETKILFTLVGGAVSYAGFMCVKKASEVRWTNKRQFNFIEKNDLKKL